MSRLALLLLLAVCVAGRNVTEPQTNAGSYNGSEPTFDNPSPIDAITLKQQLSQVYAHLYLEFTTATAWNSFASSVFALSELEKVEAVENNQGQVLEEDKDEDEKLARRPTYPSYGPAAQPNYYGSAYNNNLYPGVPVAAQANYNYNYNPAVPQPPVLTKEQQALALENVAEESLLTYLKNSQLENMFKLDQSQKTHSQITLASLELGSSQYASNPLAVQMLYLLKYKMFIDTMSSAASIIRQDAWTMWNYNEIMETKEFDNGNSVTLSFSKTLALSKSAAMHAYFHEAQIDLLSLYIDYYIQSVVSGSGSLGSLGGSSSGSSFLEMESQQSSLTNPSSIVAYTNYMRFYTRVLNYLTAQSYAFESQLELHITHSDEVLDHEKLAAANKMLDFVHTQCIYSLRSFGFVRLTLASLDLTVFALAGGFSGSLGSSIAGSLGSFGSMGSSLAAGLGSLIPAAGSLGLASLAGLGAQGSLALGALAGSSFGGSHASRSAMKMLHSMIQEDSAVTPAPEQQLVSSADVTTDPVAVAVPEPVAVAVNSPVTGLAAVPEVAAPVAAFTAPNTEYPNLIG